MLLLNDRKLFTGFCILCITVVSVFGNQLERLTVTPSLSLVLRYINDSYIVSCSALSGNPIKWINPRGDTILATKGRIHIEKNYKEKFSLVLVFTQMLLTDRGNYTCSTEDGSSTKSFNLFIMEPISFMDTPVVQNAVENSDATIKCEVRGDPEPVVSWSFNGYNIEPETNPRYSKLGDGLLIKKAQRSDSGEYTCTAFQVSEAFTNKQEQTIRLNIEHKPILSIPETPEKVFGFIDGKVNVSCFAESEPAANFSWFKDKQHLDPKKYSIFNESNSSILQINIIKSNDFGNYSCKAINHLGAAKHTILLKEHPKPKPPVSFTLRGVNSISLDFYVEPSNQTGTSDIIKFVFEYIPVDEFKKHSNWGQSKQIDFPYKKGSSYLLTHLTPDTVYYVRVASGNKAGNSDWTKEKEFKTSPQDKFSNSNRINSSFLLSTLSIILLSISIDFFSFLYINY